MENYRSTEIWQEGDNLFTIGLKSTFGKEFRVKIAEDKKRDCIFLLQYLIDYLLDYQPKLKDGQTIA